MLGHSDGLLSGMCVGGLGGGGGCGRRRSLCLTPSAIKLPLLSVGGRAGDDQRMLNQNRHQ